MYEIFISFFIVGVVPVFGQKYFVEGGGVYSTLKVSSNFTDTQLVSDKKKRGILLLLEINIFLTVSGLLKRK